MNKTLVTVIVPLLEKSYDILIPKDIQMYEVLELIKKAVSELSDGRYIPNASTVLCVKENGIIIDINKSANELGIKNGFELMLI